LESKVVRKKKDGFLERPGGNEREGLLLQTWNETKTRGDFFTVRFAMGPCRQNRLRKDRGKGMAIYRGDSYAWDRESWREKR